MKQFAHGQQSRPLLAMVALFCVSVCAAAEPPIRKASEALDSPLSADIRATSLAEMVATLARVENINLCIDESALQDAGTSSGSIGPLEISNVTLRSALHALLAPDLSFVVKNDVIVVTTADKAADDFGWSIQPVHEILQIDTEWPDYDSLIELVFSMVSPQSWPAGSGPAPISGVWGCLIFEQTPDMDDAVGYLLDALKQFKAREPEILTAIRVGSPVELEFACRLNKLLNERVDLTLDNLALADFVELLRHKSKLPIRLDQRTLDDAGITLTDSRVSLELRQVPLRVAIALALAPLKLTTYFEFEQIWISTVEAGETKTHLEVYPVLDFLPTEDKHADRSIRSLVDPLTRHLLPESWAERGGPCNVMCYYPLRCLVVSQTELGHAEVANYLQALRKARSMPPQPATLPAPPPTSSR